MRYSFYVKELQKFKRNVFSKRNTILHYLQERILKNFIIYIINKNDFLFSPFFFILRFNSSVSLFHSIFIYKSLDCKEKCIICINVLYVEFLK